MISIRNILLTELSVKTKPSSKNAALIDHISQDNSVAIHIRRGDYVTNPDANSLHGICPISYYKNVVKYLKSKFKNLDFFVFSDDPNWAKSNLSFIKYLNVVDHNDADHNYEDFRLMYSCNHFIIANSSFSWWAAWLGSSPDKIVIAPDQWFLTQEHDTRDIVPESWVRLKRSTND